MANICLECERVTDVEVVIVDRAATPESPGVARVTRACAECREEMRGRGLAVYVQTNQ